MGKTNRDEAERVASLFQTFRYSYKEMYDVLLSSYNKTFKRGRRKQRKQWEHAIIHCPRCGELPATIKKYIK